MGALDHAQGMTMCMGVKIKIHFEYYKTFQYYILF